MPAAIDTPLLELQTQLWKARAQAKQKWLEQSLAETVNSPQASARRMRWSHRALQLVKREQAEMKRQTALMDMYAEYLSAIEMTLMSAAERKDSVASGTAAERRD